MNILVISPHPDDEALGCGGTLCMHVDEGDQIRVLFLTSGEKGGHGMGEEKTRLTREREAHEASIILGIDGIEFWREDDGELRVSQKLIKRLVQTIDTYHPEIVYVPNPGESHPDHKTAACLMKAALLQIENRPKVFMFEVWTPLAKMDLIVDITPYMEKKIAAIRAYQTQCRVLKFDRAMHGLARYRGEMYLWPKTEQHKITCFAEVFQALSP